MILLTRSATKLVDRWEISDVALQLYDLQQKKITRTFPWPGGEARENVNIRFSPDGKLLYFFGDDILIVETENFTEVDTWPLSRPHRAGARPRQLRAGRRHQRRPRVLHGTLLRSRTRCRTGASWASAASTWWRRASIPSHRARRGRRLCDGAGPQARLRAAAADWPLRVLDLRSRAEEAPQPDRLRRPPADGAPRVIERPAALCLPGRGDHRRLRGRHLQIPPHHRDERRPDDQPVRPPTVGVNNRHGRQPNGTVTVPARGSLSPSESENSPRPKTGDLGPATGDRNLPTQNHFGPSNVSTFNQPNLGRFFVSLLKRIFGGKSNEPVQRTRVCVECGMPVADHKDWCSIYRGQQEMELRAAASK